MAQSCLVLCSTYLRWLLVIAVLLAAYPGSAPSSAQAPGTTLFVGVVRSGDGTLLPLASMENDVWTHLRSFDPADRDVYRFLDAQRIPREGWTYLPLRGGLARPLAINNIVTIDAHCKHQEGFATNAPPLAPKLDSPHLMGGVAIHGSFSAVRVEDMLRQPDAASRRVSRFVVQLTHALEAETSTVRPELPPAIPPKDRERVSVQIATLARDRVGDGGAHGYVDYYYFEAHKRYLGIESYVHGWLVSSPGSLSVLRTNAGLHRRGRPSGRQMGRVLGVLRIRRSSVWVMEMRGYESDTYEIFEPGVPRVSRFYGGGC